MQSSLVRLYRTLGGISQDSLALEIGRSQAFISRLERGDAQTTPLEARKISKKLGIPYRTIKDECHD